MNLGDALLGTAVLEIGGMLVGIIGLVMAGLAAVARRRRSDAKGGVEE